MAQRTNTDTGKPSGVDKSEQGTGIPSKISDENSATDSRLSEEYTRDENEVSEGVRELHPNRNVDKIGRSGH